MAAKKVVLSVRVAPSLAKEIDDLAKCEDLSRSEMVIRLIQNGLSREVPKFLREEKAKVASTSAASKSPPAVPATPAPADDKHVKKGPPRRGYPY